MLNNFNHDIFDLFKDFNESINISNKSKIVNNEQQNWIPGLVCKDIIGSVKNIV